jgi:PAS domain S-box-containing protein
MRRRSRAGGELVKARRPKAIKPKRSSALKAVRGRSSSTAGPKDASNARRLERSLRESEERYALVSQAVAEGIYDWNIELNSLFVSSRLMEIFSFEGPGLTSEDWYRRVHPEDKESYRTALRDCFKQRALKLECQYRIRAADGNYRWVEDHGLPIRNKVGRAIRLVGAVNDISRRHQTEQALRDRDQELDAVLDTIDYGILFMGPDLRAKIINRAFRQMWGISDEFIRMKRPTMSDLINYNRYNNLYDVPPTTEFDDYVARRVEAVRGGTRLMSEMRRLDGRIIQYQALPLPDGGRMLTYFDITDMKLSEERAGTARDAAETALINLQNAQDRLVQTEKLASLGQLTAGIAHEIKNPLNFVNNFSAVSVEFIDELREVLGGAQLDSKLRAEIGEIADALQSNLDKVVQHGNRADAIVKNMLLHSRQGSGDRRPVEINTLVEESLNLAYHGTRAEKQGFTITLERSFDPAAGEVDIFPQEITRALLNMISNGFYAATKRKAEADGDNYEPTLAATTKNLGDSVEIKIRDNGTGIPPEEREKLFSPFFTTKPPGEGTGLGLSISHDIIVKQHGGSIEVDTQPGEFTEFRIVLPRAGASLIKSGERTSH